jgi:hypothetical protein
VTRLEGVFVLAVVWCRVYDEGYRRARLKLRVLSGDAAGAAAWLTVSLDLGRPGVAAFLGVWARVLGARELDVSSDEKVRALFLGRPFKAALVMRSTRRGEALRIARVEDNAAWTDSERERAERFVELWRLRGEKESD